LVKEEFPKIDQVHSRIKNTKGTKPFNYKTIWQHANKQLAQKLSRHFPQNPVASDRRRRGAQIHLNAKAA